MNNYKFSFNNYILCSTSDYSNNNNQKDKNEVLRRKTLILWLNLNESRRINYDLIYIYIKTLFYYFYLFIKFYY